MSYNLEIMVLGQKDAKVVPIKSKIKVYHEFERENWKVRASDTWKFMSYQPGVWYSMGIIDEDDWFWAFDLLDTDFDKLINQDRYNWINDKDYLENITPLRVKKQYFADFKKILEYLIDLSPIKTIMMYARYQGGDEEIIQGPIPFEKYMEMLQKDEIPFNVCSIITK